MSSPLSHAAGAEAQCPVWRSVTSCGVGFPRPDFLFCLPKLMGAGSVMAIQSRQLLLNRLPPLLDAVGHVGELLLKPALRILERALRFRDAAR